jgi:PHS family inorganic phosphate transporter-like MFS transporter
MNTTVVNNAISGVNGITNSVDKLRYSLLSTVYIMGLAIPGYFFAIFFIDRMGRWYMQMQGFIMSAVCFIILAAAYYTPLRTSAGGAGFVIFYGLTYFFANFGPNSITFILPVEVILCLSVPVEKGCGVRRRQHADHVRS